MQTRDATHKLKATGVGSLNLGHGMEQIYEHHPHFRHHHGVIGAEPLFSLAQNVYLFPSSAEKGLRLSQSIACDPNARWDESSETSAGHRRLCRSLNMQET
jgi:hypothetical protein